MQNYNNTEKSAQGKKPDISLNVRSNHIFIRTIVVLINCCHHVHERDLRGLKKPPSNGVDKCPEILTLQKIAPVKSQ